MRVRDFGERTLVHGVLRGAGAASGAPIERAMWLVVGWREQKEVWWHSFESESEAVEAVKLEEVERVDRDDGRQPNIPERLGGLVCQA